MRVKIVALIGSVLLHSRPFARRNAAAATADPDEAEANAEESNYLDQALSTIPDLESPGQAPPPGPQDRRDAGQVVDEDLMPPAPATKATTPGAPKKKEDAAAAPSDDKSTKPDAAAPPVAAPTGDEPLVVPGDDKSAGADDGDAELDAELSKFEEKTPGTAKGIGELKRFVKQKNQEFKQARKQLEDDLKTARDQLEELKKKAPSDEQLARMEELQDYIRNTDIEHDPEFRTKYDGAIKKIDTDLISLLQTAGMKEQVAKVIADRGGIVKFSQSDEPVGENFKNQDKSPMTEQQFFEKYVFEPLSATQKHQVTHLLVSAKSKLRERDEEIATVKANAPEYIKQRQQKVLAQFNNRAQTRLVDLVKALPEDMPRDIMPIPDKATKEERERIEAANKDFKEANDYILNMVTANTPEDRAEVAFYAAIGKYLLLKERDLNKKEVADWKARAEKAEASLTEIKEAQSMGRHRNAPAGEKKNVPNRKMTDEEAVDAGLP